MFSTRSRPPQVAPPGDRWIRDRRPPIEPQPVPPVEPRIPQPGDIGPEPGLPAPPDVWFRSRNPGADSAAATATGASAASNGSRPGRGSPRWSTNFTIGFQPPASGSRDLASSLSARITQSGGMQTRSPIAVSVEGGTATLRGVVATPRDRELAGHLVRFEPGIWQVNNELTIAR